MNSAPHTVETVLASACLLGANCRYDGNSCQDERLIADSFHYIYIPICPEQLGGLPTPRPKSFFRLGSGCEVLDGKAEVIDEYGNNVTDNFLRGARETLKIAERFNVKKAFLKSGSPSCGFGFVNIEDKSSPGSGVCAALLFRNGIEIVTIQ